MKLIGVDVGGTFTDLVFADTDDGRTEIHKVPTTPSDPSQGVIEGILALCGRFAIPPSEVDHVLHGTTTATNAVLEHDGCRAGIITTRGYRDILHIGRHQRPQHYSIRQEIPWQARPLVRRRHRKVVTERLGAPHGEVLTPLDEEEVHQAARELREAGVEAVAVCFLFSYLDPRHEDRAAEILRQEIPDVFVTTSSSVAPQFREFERFTTAAMNAFIGPKVRRYVSRLETRMAEVGLRADLHVMGSNGGVATVNMVADRPVLTLLSGPAAGVLGGAWAGALSGRRNLITFDVGGTSADIGIVRDGRYVEATARDTWIAGYPLMVPMIDIHTIGAGGGSIAHLDAGGVFRVGPRSAGAVPGPAAYRRGGALPTVTDANLVLGRLDPGNFLGGDMSLDADASRRVIGALADELGIDPVAAAEGVLAIVNANMANAIRSRTIQKGLDPRDFSLVAFGGAGPLHGVEVAALLGIPEVIVPPHPGITSATGLLTTDLKYDAIRTEFLPGHAADLRRLEADFTAMERELADQLRADGIDPAGATYQRSGDLRYVGQGYELRVPISGGAVDAGTLEDALRHFHEMHRAEYGHGFPDKPVEIVNIRLTATGPMPKVKRPAEPRGGTLSEALVRTGPCVFRGPDGLAEHETPYLRRDRLPLDTAIPGPAIVLQKDTTVIVPPGASATAGRDGNLIIRLEEQS